MTGQENVSSPPSLVSPDLQVFIATNSKKEIFKHWTAMQKCVLSLFMIFFPLKECHFSLHSEINVSPDEEALSHLNVLNFFSCRLVCYFYCKIKRLRALGDCMSACHHLQLTRGDWMSASRHLQLILLMTLQTTK